MTKIRSVKVAAPAVAAVLALAMFGAAPAGVGAGVVMPQGAAASTLTDVDRLVAPIALYPDALLAQMLMCASDPASVTSLNTWLAKMTKVKGTALQEAAGKAGYAPSFVALALFPDVVKQMAEQLDWTTKLGEVFTANRTMVFDSIQKLRIQARNVGSLKTTAQQEVQTETTAAGQEVIVIESANPQIVYVPTYNPQVVYTQPMTTTNTVVIDNTSSTDAAVAGMVGFTAGIVIGAAVNNSYYYGPYGYHGGGYMYNDAWDDYYDHREDAREDWQDNREDISDNRRENVEERSDRAGTKQENRTERQGNRTETQGTRTENASAAKGQRQTQSASATPSTQSRGYSQGDKATQKKSSGGSDAFSGYSSGKSERAASSRGQQSRGSRGGGSSRSGGGRRR